MADAAEDDVSHGFFTFDPRLLLADVRNAVDDYIADASDAIEAALTEDCASGGGAAAVSAATSAEIQEGTDKLNAKLVETFSQQYSILGNYAARNIFNVDEDIAVMAAQQAAAAAAAASGGGGDGSGGGGDGDGDVGEEAAQGVDAELKELRLKLSKARQEEQALGARQRQIDALADVFNEHGKDLDQIKAMFGSRGKAHADFEQLNSAARTLKGIQADAAQVQVQLDSKKQQPRGGSSSRRQTRSSSSSSSSS